MVTVDTPRLRLQLPSAADAQAFLDIHQDPEVLKYVVLGAASTGLTAAWRNIATIVGHWHMRGYGQWAVVERDSGLVVGRVGLWNPEGWPGIELGWVIHREHWGRGFATEAALAALAWAWTHVDVDEIISMIQPDNVRSLRVAAKLGQSFSRTEVLNGTTLHVYAIDRPAAPDAGPADLSRA
jgi:RimJ/RimL family protein N-acetyltransferase